MRGYQNLFSFLFLPGDTDLPLESPKSPKAVGWWFRDFVRALHVQSQVKGQALLLSSCGSWAAPWLVTSSGDLVTFAPWKSLLPVGPTQEPKYNLAEAP